MKHTRYLRFYADERLDLHHGQTRSLSEQLVYVVRDICGGVLEITRSREADWVAKIIVDDKGLRLLSVGLEHDVCARFSEKKLD